MLNNVEKKKLNKAGFFRFFERANIVFTLLIKIVFFWSLIFVYSLLFFYNHRKKSIEDAGNDLVVAS